MLLAIDTSTSKRGSIALWSKNAVLAHRIVEPSTPLAVAVKDAVPDLSAIEHYAVTIGPGSFTGLRIGLAFLKGLAFVHPRPVIAVSTLCVLAKALLDADPTAELALPMIDARRNEAYGALYTRGLMPHPALEEAAHPIAAIAARVRAVREARIVAGGDGLALPHAADVPWIAAPRELWIPDARTLAAIAASRTHAGVAAELLEPAYLQLAPAEVPSASL